MLISSPAEVLAVSLSRALCPVRHTGTRLQVNGGDTAQDGFRRPGVFQPLPIGREIRIDDYLRHER